MNKNLADTIKILSLLYCVTMLSCKKVTVDLGSDFVDNSTTNIAYVDSLTLEISTNYVDSFATSATGAILAGNFSDPMVGRIAATSFIQLGTPAAFSIPNGAIFDSLEVILKFNKNYYGDTLTPYTVAIHQLNVPIKLAGEQSEFYNTNSVAYNTTALGHTQLLIRPAVTDTISVKLAASMGQELFNKMVSSDDQVLNLTQFTDYFRGLAITGDASNNLLMAFKDSMTMRLHYRNPGVINTDATIDFSINTNTNQFNHITNDRKGTPLASLGAGNKQLLSAQTQNAVYGQYLGGAMIKIRFPYLTNLLQLNDFVKIIRADLILKPEKNSFTGYYTLPPSLRLATTDQFNYPLTDLTAYSSSTGSTSVQYGDLVIDKLYGTETAYTYDITNYLLDEIAKTDINKNGLLLLPPDPTQSFSRVIIGDGLNSGGKSQVKIYYATVK